MRLNNDVTIFVRNLLDFAHRTNGLSMGSLQPGDHCKPKQIRLSHNFKIIVTGRKHIIVGNRKNRSLGHYMHFGLHGLPAWTPQSPNSTAQYANVFLYVLVLLIQSEERERAHVHDMSTIWGFRAHGLHARGTSTPKPTRQRSESMGMMFDMLKILIYLLQCEKKSMWQNLTSPSLDSLTEQMGSQWALSMATSEPKLHHAEPGISKCYFICYCIDFTKWEKRKRTFIRYPTEIWAFRARGFPTRGTSTPKPTCQRSESVGMMFDMQKSLIYLLQCEKKSMWQNLSSPNELGFAYRKNGLPMGSQHGHLGAQIPPRRTWTKQMLFYMLFYWFYKVRKEIEQIYDIRPKYGLSEPVGSEPVGPAHPNPPIRVRSLLG